MSEEYVSVPKEFILSLAEAIYVRYEILAHLAHKKGNKMTAQEIQDILERHLRMRNLPLKVTTLDEALEDIAAIVSAVILNENNKEDIENTKKGFEEFQKLPKTFHTFGKMETRYPLFDIIDGLKKGQEALHDALKLLEKQSAVAIMETK